MTRENFLRFMREQGFALNDNCRFNVTRLSIGLLDNRQNLVGVHFHSQAQLGKPEQLNGPWFASLAQMVLGNIPGISVCVPNRQIPGAGETAHDEGYAVEVKLDNVIFSENRENDDL